MIMLTKDPVFLTLMVLYVKCSRVIDKHQQAIYVSDYCPEIGICTEGSHVMCTHYNPNRQVGPLCADTRNVTMTEEYAEILLELLNGVRSRAAKGLTTGYKKQMLPRGYGIFRLQWDPELATFAQVWANQCIIERDMCRATKKFPDPGQLVVVTLFSDPDWLLMRRRELFNTTGFSLEKIKYTLTSATRSWYNTKNLVDTDIILGREWTPNLLKTPYLQMVQGSATHVGCGISTFKTFLYLSNSTELLYNMVRLVCNFSTRPRKGDIYTTDPPTEVGYTVKCGCPLGYDEDPDCLCYESGRGLPFSCRYGQCKPQVVILPIFTVEDAPPHKLIEKRSENESSMKLMKRKELNRHNDMRSRWRFKPSLFSKSSIFVLPTRKLKLGKTNIGKIDSMRNLTNFGYTRHLSERPSMAGIYDKIDEKSNHFQRQLKSWEMNDNNRNVGRKDFLKHYERKNNRSSRAMSNEFTPKRNLGVDSSNEKPNTNIMDILNKLEQEAKFIQLNETDKDILDHKIQRIYKEFLVKSKYSRNKEIFNNNDFNLFDYESNNLYKFEDQIKRIKEYDNVIGEPINDSENIESKSINRLKNLNNINLIGLRNTYAVKDRTKYNSIKHLENDLMEDGFLNLDRRKYYQNKLNHLERKIRHLRSFDRGKDISDNDRFKHIIPTYPTLKWRRKRPNIGTT